MFTSEERLLQSELSNYFLTIGMIWSTELPGIVSKLNLIGMYAIGLKSNNISAFDYIVITCLEFIKLNLVLCK